jgi:acetolactate synthase-1/2/3 large subunit
MAHAHAELSGALGVAMVTAGPGVTNTVTAIANASLARAPVLTDRRLYGAPAGQHGSAPGHSSCRHPKPVTRTARTARVAEQVIREFDDVARATGDLGEPGPV